MHINDLPEDITIPIIRDTSRISPNQLSGKRVDMEFLQEVAGRIQKLVPHIAKLDAHGMCSSPFLENFYGLLIATYSGQLGRMVIRNKVVAMPGMLHFSKLTRLVITINAESVGYLPYIHAESLVFLSMKKVPIDFTWSTNGSSVVFSNLHDLDVEYGWYNVKDRLIDQKIKAAVHSCTLLFPAIKRMRIRGIMNHFPVMLYGKFASDMELVDIVGTKKAIEYVLVGKVPQARNLVMDASLDNYMLDTNELYAIESLSNSSKINLVLKLNILRRSVIPMLDNIALSRLTELCILPTMEINKTMDLISRLPCLEYLRICLGQTEVSSDEMRPSETVGPQNMCEKPISTSLIIISLQFSASNWVSDNNIHAFKRLCLAIPSLSKIHAFQIPKKLIAEFVEEYKHDYPHLAYTRMYA
ncbi:hypothetical protein H4R24_001767 [Coemansia sp. RSA 988]|nr:hypothetical protein H4R24_001767 [Coemansia sp. RSA 988]